MTVDTGYFERMYAGSADPWEFETRWYDRRKYQLTAACLPRPRYRSGFEPACSIGVLSTLLAPRCASLLCGDLVPAAVQRARRRLAEHPHVRVERQALPQDWPDATFDLIVLSEVLYYFTDDQLERVLDRTRGSLEPDGDLIVAHWRHPVAEHHRSGDEVHEAIGGMAGLARLGGYLDDDFRLDVFTRTPPPPRSVAAIDGLTG
ncbi:MAG TPA: SAM-dependent methyltransferase [Rugosimonospora sp.]|jgi:SAM-dependent methyltransferase